VLHFFVDEDNYKEVEHRLGSNPDMVSVQIFLETGYISDDQGRLLNILPLYVL